MLSGSAREPLLFAWLLVNAPSFPRATEVCVAVLKEASVCYLLIITCPEEYWMCWFLGISLMVEAVTKMGRWQKSAKHVVELRNVSLKAAFLSASKDLWILFTVFFFFFHSVFIILKMLYKELIDRPALLSSDPPVNPRFAKPKDPSLLPPQPKRQVGAHMGSTWQAHNFSYCWELSVFVYKISWCNLQSYQIYLPEKCESHVKI